MTSPKGEKEMEVGYVAAAERIEIEIGAPIGRVLDLGCNIGAGMETLQARWSKAEIWGLEPEIRHARLARAKGFNVIVAGAELMPYWDECFELVFSRHSLEHVENRAQALAEILRVLKPSGHLYVQAPIEPGGSPNRLHVSPFCSLEECRAAFPGFKEIYWGPQETVAEFIGVKV